MAAKNVQDALRIGSKELLADYDYLLNELKDYIAHRVLILPCTASAMDLFNDLFREGEKSNDQ